MYKWTNAASGKIIFLYHLLYQYSSPLSYLYTRLYSYFLVLLIHTIFTIVASRKKYEKGNKVWDQISKLEATNRPVLVSKTVFILDKIENNLEND